jgi:RNA polymerase sigma-70 factor (ECF subfamily)
MIPPPTHGVLETTFRLERRRVLATLIRLLGGFEEAEDALHDAFAAAAEQWPRDGVPANPRAWLVSAGRFKTIDRWRRQGRARGVLADVEVLAQRTWEAPPVHPIQDDELRLIFTCCHPALPPDARIALTLREVGGLTTEEIARAYLTSAPTVAQRIVRAKSKIRDDAIPYEVPGRTELPARLESVLQVLYLIFNEGYAATGGPDLTRQALCGEALRLVGVLAQLQGNPEVLGLRALMLLHQSRRETRVDAAGDLILLEHQDRNRWDRALITQAQSLIQQAIEMGRVGPYVLQAAIASVHADATDISTTDWKQVVGLYDVLMRVAPSPVVAINRAAAVGMRDGPQAGLDAVDDVMRDGSLDSYHLAHAARADMLRRLGQRDGARAAYARARLLTQQPAELRFLDARIHALSPES